MRRLFVLSIVVVALSGAGRASTTQAVSAEKEAAILRFVEMTGSMDVGQQMSEGLVSMMPASIRAENPDVPPEVFEAVSGAVSQILEENLPELLAMIVPIYDRQFSLQEIEGLIAFYETELGQKVTSTMPAIAQESMLVGQQWGAALELQFEARMLEVLEELRAAGVNLPAPPGQ